MADRGDEGQILELESFQAEWESTDAVSGGPVCLTQVRGRPGRLAPSSIGVLGLGAQSTRVKSRIRIGPKGRRRESD